MSNISVFSALYRIITSGMPVEQIVSVYTLAVWRDKKTPFIIFLFSLLWNIFLENQKPV